jgi:hypothetical protein
MKDSETSQKDSVIKPSTDLKEADKANIAPLSDADLENVAGGLNPQPLPPMVRAPT